MSSLTATYVVVPMVAFVAGVLNAVAGGGTFFMFPTLTGIARLTEKAANMTSTVGLWPGSLASVIAAARELRKVPREMLLGYSALSVVGGAGGSALLLATSESSFEKVVPWLLAFATVVFAFSKRITGWAQAQRAKRAGAWRVGVAFAQLLVAVYGGYFGAGIGILMLAGLALAGVEDIQVLTALKVLLATMINGVAVLVFVGYVLWIGRGSATVSWAYAIPMALASSAGGFAGIAIARRVKQNVLRVFILTVAVGLTAAYFWKAYA